FALGFGERRPGPQPTHDVAFLHRAKREMHPSSEVTNFALIEHTPSDGQLRGHLGLDIESRHALPSEHLSVEVVRLSRGPITNQSNLAETDPVFPSHISNRQPMLEVILAGDRVLKRLARAHLSCTPCYHEILHAREALRPQPDRA